MNLHLTKRKPNEVKVLEVRSVKTADLELLRQKVAPTPIKTLRDRHHHIAWLIALGKSNTDIAVECRVSPGRVSQHKSSPAFQELIAKYRRDVADARLDATRDFVDSATRNMVNGERLIDRALTSVIDDPDAKVDLRTINRIVSDRMDRFGYGKHTTSTNINANFGANLDAAIARSKRIA